MRYLVEGGVRKSGSQIRVTAQLVWSLYVAEVDAVLGQSQEASGALLTDLT